MEMKKITGIGGLLSAGVGWVCCVGPLVLGGLGFGAGGISFARDFGFLHYPLIGLAILLLGSAFYLHFRRKADPAGGASCRAGNSNAN